MNHTLTLLTALLLAPAAALHAAEKTTMTQIGKGYATTGVNVAIFRMSSLATFQNTQWKVTMAESTDADYREWKFRGLTAESVGEWEPTHDSALWQRENRLHLLVQKCRDPWLIRPGPEAPPEPVYVLEWQSPGLALGVGAATGPLRQSSPPVVLEGRFGKAEVDTQGPSLVRLHLREADGSLSLKNLLSLHPSHMHCWAVGGYRYVVDAVGNRSESRRSTGHRVEQTEGRLRLTGVKLADAAGKAAPLTEDGELAVTEDGKLRWQIVRKWDAEFAGKFSGAPALFFNTRPNEIDTRRARGRGDLPNPAGNGVITSLWLESDSLDGFWSADDYVPWDKKPWEPGKAPGGPGPFAKHLCITAKDADAWAVVKLYTSFPLGVDLRAAPQGHLYRRGAADAFSEIGVVGVTDQTFTAMAGRVATTALTLSSQPKDDTGYRLAVKLPDADAEKALRRYYNGLLNGGTLCDMKLHDIGNETEGWRFGGTPWFASIAIAAGVPTLHPASSKPVSVAQALRESLDMRLDALKADGRLDWGFTHEAGKVLVECQTSLAAGNRTDQRIDSRRTRKGTPTRDGSSASAVGVGRHGGHDFHHPRPAAAWSGSHGLRLLERDGARHVCVGQDG